jgi:hypothetical protein
MGKLVELGWFRGNPFQSLPMGTGNPQLNGISTESLHFMGDISDLGGCMPQYVGYDHGAMLLGVGDLMFPLLQRKITVEFNII